MGILYGGSGPLDRRLFAVLLVGFAVVTISCGSRSEGEDLRTETSAASPLEAEELWRASVAAVEALGPTNVTVAQDDEVWVDGVKQSDSVLVVELLDSASGRALCTIGREGSIVSKTAVDGRRLQSLVLEPPTGFSETARASVRPGLPLPLYAGDIAEHMDTGYGELFSTDGPDGGSDSDVTGVVFEETPEGRLVSQVQESDQSRREIRVLLGSDLLPREITVVSEGSLEGIEYRRVCRQTFAYASIDPLSREDVTLEPPEDYWRVSRTLDLDLEHPVSPEADFGQYWLGPAFREYELIMAFHSRMHDNPDLGPGAEPAQEEITMVYDDPSRSEARSDNEDVQVVVRSLDSMEAKSTREDLKSGKFPSREGTVAGRPALIGWRGAEDESFVERYMVLLPDAMVILTPWIPVDDPRVVLDALEPLE